MSLPGKISWKEARRWIPGLLVSVTAIIVIVKLASWPDLVTALSSFKAANLAIAILFTVASLGTRAAAWKILLDHRPNFSQTFFIINEGYLLNNLFPLRAGEIGRAVFMGQASGLGPYHVLSTIVIERAFDLAMAAGLLLATLPLALGFEWAKPVALFTLLLVFGGLLALFLAARYNLKVRQWVEQAGMRWPFIQRYLVPRLGSLLDGLEVLTKPSKFLASLFWILISWVIWVSTHFVMLRSIAPEAPFWWAAFADGVLAMGVAVPSAPAALGVFEASLAGALSLLGISFNVAIAYAIVMHFLQFLPTGIFGLWGLVQERRSLSGLFAQIQIKNKSAS